MNRSSLLAILIGGALLGPTFAPSAAAELPDRLSVDWIHSESGKSAGRIPAYQFVGDTLMRYDERVPHDQRTLEFLDIESGAVRSRVDAAAALASLERLIRTPTESESSQPDGATGDGDDEQDADEEGKELGKPSAVSPDGRLGLYSREGDLFLLDFAASSFRRLTETAEKETSARFSPDGTRVAFVRESDLYAVGVADGKELRLTEGGTETTLNGKLSWVYWEELFGRRDRGYLFSPDSKRIAYLQFDDSSVDVMTFIDPKPDATRVIRQRYPKAGTTNPRVRAGVVDLDGGETTWIDLGRNPYEYLVRLVWLPDGKRLVVQALDRAQQNLDLFVVDAATGEARHLFRESDEAWIDVHDDLIFLTRDDRFVWASDRAGQTHLYLYELTADGARPVRALTSGDWSVAGGANRPDGLRGAVAAVDEDNGWVYFMATRESHLETHLYRVGLDGTGMKRLTPDAGMHGITWSPGGKFFMDAHSSLTRPPATDLRHANGRIARQLIEPSRELADHFGFGATELITVKAKDGFELPATLVKPAGFDPGKRYPVVVNVYGGPAAPRVRQRWNGGLFDRLLAQEGFVVFTIDPRTSTAMGKVGTRLLLRDFYGEREAEDIVAGVRWLKGQPFVDPDRVGVTGWSGGGTTTVSVMTRSKEFRAGIAGAGVYDWRLYDTIYTERFMKRPADNPEGYERNAMQDRIESLHGRLLLLHGTYDDNVHPQNTLRLVDKLIDAGIVFDLGVYPMRKHGFGDDEARAHRDKTRLAFWKRELGSPAAPGR